jgi:hypothetical protein
MHVRAFPKSGLRFIARNGNHVPLAPSQYHRSYARRLRDDSRSSKEVLHYLESENRYADAYFVQLQPLVDNLADSMDAALPHVEVSQVRLACTRVSSSNNSSIIRRKMIVLC